MRVVPALTLLFLFGSLSVHGDTLVLRNGGKLEGRVKINRDSDNKISDYVIALDTGGHVKLDPSRIRRHIKPTINEKSYDSLVATMPDTARNHWTMAEFCRKNKLHDARNFHVQRTLLLDPNHAEARKSEGYSWRDGTWVRQDEVMEQRGYVLYQGRWLLPQQVADLEQADEFKRQQGQVRSEVMRWRSWLGGRKHDQAIEGFETVKDPLAKFPLVEILRKEKSPENREIYLKSLSRFEGTDVTRELVETALHDNDERVLELAIELLLKRPEKAYAATLLLPYLNSSDNWSINQAALILGKLKFDDAVLPLIGSLITTHKTTIVPSGNVRPTFAQGPNGGGIGLQAGTKPKVISEDKRNSYVLGALVTITGKNFQYSEYEWREWYKKQRAPMTVNLRRDF
jgi:hypothetical protein